MTPFQKAVTEALKPLGFVFAGHGEWYHRATGIYIDVTTPVMQRQYGLRWQFKRWSPEKKELVRIFRRIRARKDETQAKEIFNIAQDLLKGDKWQEALA